MLRTAGSARRNSPSSPPVYPAEIIRHMKPKSPTSRLLFTGTVATLAIIAAFYGRAANGQKDTPTQNAAPQNSGTENTGTKNTGTKNTGTVDPAMAAAEKSFQEHIQPLLQKYCWRCHNAEEMESGIRVDQLTAAPEDRQIYLWNDIRKQIAEGNMPPAEEPQPTADQRQLLTDWITRTVTAARSRNTQKNGSVRRLTVSQYRNTLRDLLGLEEDISDVLPPDGISKDGFANNGHTMVLSPLQVEAYFDIAQKALDLCIVDENSKPVIQNFRMDLGEAINPQPCPDNLILGANSLLLNNADFMVTELQPKKPFEYQPFAMRKAYEFIEGYVGNDTIRQWKKFDSIYHSVFACMRGTPRYTVGEPYSVVPSGLILRPAIPSPEIFGKSDTYGPMANFKISLRELPDEGNFRVTVKAARYDDGLLLEKGVPTANLTESPELRIGDLSAPAGTTVMIEQPGIYQVDLHYKLDASRDTLHLKLGERLFSKFVVGDNLQPWVLIRLEKGPLKLNATAAEPKTKFQRAVLTRVAEDSELGRRFLTFERRLPSIGVHVGLRRDCGSTLTQVGGPRAVVSGTLQEYVFEGAIKDYPSPDVEKDNVNYLAGIREIGIRSEYTDGRDMPRLLIRSVEFEGPYYTSWPPATHRNIFIESPNRGEPATYAREIIRSFATRAFRRPIAAAEEAAIFAVWQKSFAEIGNARAAAGANSDQTANADQSRDSQHDFQQSIKDALLVVLTSPQFLFLIENSSGPQAEDLDAYELASKLSYFLWNAPPDQQLLERAAKNTLQPSLDAEIERMIHDPRFGQCMSEFAAQWLSLDKFDVVATDALLYPKLARDTKTQLRQEPVQFLRYLIENNLSLRNLVQSDFIYANEVVASYYNLGDRTENGFQFVPIKHANQNLGGVLTQAGILAGLSDGRESNPIKRGAWLARKIIADPPDDPPPNVPQLKDDDAGKLTLREKLERHRNQKGCAKCHSGIDPWGIPFESFDAAGLLKSTATDPHSTLPDGTEIKDLAGLKTYLAQDRIDQVAFSFVKHVATYAVGRTLTYNEIEFLKEHCTKLKSKPSDVQYNALDMVKFIIKSDLFMKK